VVVAPCKGIVDASDSYRVDRLDLGRYSARCLSLDRLLEHIANWGDTALLADISSQP